MSATVSVLSWNVNGIRAVYKKGFLEWLQQEAPDVLCIQETKARADQLPEDLINPPGYRTFWSAAEKKGYSGVAVFTKIKPTAVTTSLGIDRFDAEGRFIRIDFADFTLFNVYFPNGKRDRERLDFKLTFYDAFFDMIEKLRKTNNRLMFCGDLNTAHNEIDLARPKENETVSGFLPIERRWIDKVVAHGHVDTFRHFHPEKIQYTWWDLKTRARERNIGWRLDYVFVTRELLPSVKSAFILTEVLGSDHCPVGLKLEQKVNR
ncbi:MAG: exodeoxyribonuclease III [Desulfomonile sp.]|nr:exodeoxyribonuclease III [Desulfomonile sp.]